MVLFLNDAAREVCETCGIELPYARQISDDELPANLPLLLKR